MYAKILLCSDGSEHALKAADHAVAMVKAFGGALTVVHVFQPPVIPFAGEGGMGLDPSLYEPPAKEVQDAVAKPVHEKLNSAGVPFADERRIGHPVEEIAALIEEGSFDLVVLGSRGLSGLKAFFLGSVSDRVAHQAHCSVLIVK
jgi:nucleotide-binding universal stress UspA family protein